MPREQNPVTVQVTPALRAYATPMTSQYVQECKNFTKLPSYLVNLWHTVPIRIKYYKMKLDFSSLLRIFSIGNSQVADVT
jgi:hypothetical protein